MMPKFTLKLMIGWDSTFGNENTYITRTSRILFTMLSIKNKVLLASDFRYFIIKRFPPALSYITHSVLRKYRLITLHLWKRRLLKAGLI